MDIYKKASKNKTRISTTKGLLTIEQLWTLSFSELDSLAISLKEELEKSETKSFLTKPVSGSEKTKLHFDLVLDVLQTKVKDHEIASKAQETKASNEKINNLIAEKKDGAMRDMTIEELEAMLK